LGYSGNMYAQATEVITTQGDLRRGDSSGNPERLAIGSTGKVLQSNGTTESWETLTTADSVLTTHGDILYESASALARLGQSTNNYTLATKGSGANPAWQASPTSVMSGTGDLLYSSGANTLARLAAGTQNYNLQMGASVPAWAASSTSIMSAAGDILYASGANTLAKLAKATDGDTLQLASGVPAWVTVSGGGQAVCQGSSGVDSAGKAQGIREGRSGYASCWGSSQWEENGSTGDYYIPCPFDLTVTEVGCIVQQNNCNAESDLSIASVAATEVAIAATSTGEKTATGLSVSFSEDASMYWRSHPVGSDDQTLAIASAWFLYTID